MDENATEAEFSLSPAFDDGHNSPDLTLNRISLYKVKSITNGVTYDISGATEILEGSGKLTYTSADKVLKYVATLDSGYYVLTATYLVGNQDFIQLKFDS